MRDATSIVIVSGPLIFIQQMSSVVKATHQLQKTPISKGGGMNEYEVLVSAFV